ncbi:hypothetical protein E2C01_073490 [Portunus trituberculatus]|uniref:Uncharacterized protein n=1 Tax=Portunus trituberculatus TaxID=210409 RepID=A0A5B7I336_PORTR|nr:hypothetical protein [Portunus trituberculatus]
MRLGEAGRGWERCQQPCHPHTSLTSPAHLSRSSAPQGKHHIPSTYPEESRPFYSPCLTRASPAGKWEVKEDEVAEGVDGGKEDSTLIKYVDMLRGVACLAVNGSTWYILSVP